MIIDLEILFRAVIDVTYCVTQNTPKITNVSILSNNHI